MRRLHFCRLTVFHFALACTVAFAQTPVFTSPLPTGVHLDAVGDTVELGSMPLNVVAAPTADTVVVVLSGWREQGIQFVDLKTRKVTQTLLQDGAFYGAAFSPDGNTLYVSGGNTDLLFIYAWKDGKATLAKKFELAKAKTADGTGTSYPAGVAVSPNGKFVYVANENGTPGVAGNVAMFTINAMTGTLTSIGTIAAGTDPVSVTVDPTGKFSYVANSGSNDVSMFTINATTGALASLGTIAAGTNPGFVAVDPAGKFAYVTNFKSNDVSMYTINSTTGVLMPIGSIAAGTSPTSIAVHPSGKFAYVTNSMSNDVSIYSIDGATGALTLIETTGT